MEIPMKVAPLGDKRLPVLQDRGYEIL